MSVYPLTFALKAYSSDSIYLIQLNRHMNEPWLIPNQNCQNNLVEILIIASLYKLTLFLAQLFEE